MNNRIEKLAEGCFKHISGTLDGDITVFDHQKFAELIIQEYEKLLPEFCPWVYADKDGPMEGWHVAFVARKHFGIE